MMQSTNRNGQSIGVGAVIACALFIGGVAIGQVGSASSLGLTGGDQIGLIEGPKAKPAAKPASKPAAKPAAKPARKQAAPPKRQAAPTRKATPKKAAPRKQAVRPKAQAQPKTQPKAQPKAQPKPKPKAQPKTQPKTQPKRVQPKPKAKPQPRPQPKPKATPRPKPATKPATRPATKPTTRPATRPTTTTKTTNRPVRDVVNTQTTQKQKQQDTRKQTLGNPDGFTQNPGTGTDSDARLGIRDVPKGVQKQKYAGSSGTALSAAKGSVHRPVIREATTPSGFDIDLARKNYLDRAGNGRAGGSMKDAGHSMRPKDGDGFHDDGHHDNGHDDGHNDGHDDYHDGYKDGYHNGHDDGEDHTNISVYISSNYGCPNGWWYVYGDYDGDGYTDYVCTNGYNSVYWYGWSGSFWGASPWYGWYGSSYAYSWWYYSVPDRYRGPIYGQSGDLSTDGSYSSTPSYVEEVPEAMPLSAIEVARLEMSIGNPEYAIEAYRAHLSEYPNDWIAVRELGLAKIRTGDRGDGIAMVSYAYSMEPTLAYEAVPAGLFENSDALMRDSVIDVVGWGHRNPSASAWLTVAVLMQAEGRDGPALRMIERARGYGLDRSVDAEMSSALTHR